MRQSAVAGMHLRPVGFAIGILLVILAGAMVPSMMLDLLAAHADWQVFALSAASTLFVGVSLILINRTSEPPEMGTRETFLLTTLAWLFVAVLGSLPFALSDLDLGLAGAFFESMSGITTTGSTVIVGLDYAPPGILLWRAILQWLGGIGIIVMGVAILPVLSIGGMQLFRSESSDRSEKVLPRAAQIASAIGILYLCLTLACVALYWAFEMTLFDAVLHAMTTIATGGYATSDASIGHFQDARIEWTAIAFMFIAGIPFVLYIHAWKGRPGALLHDVQVRWFAVVILLCATLIFLWLLVSETLGVHDAFRHALFTVISVITGTGYASIDYGTWGTFPLALLFFLTCVGGCNGSTTGGLKIFRFVILYQVARLQIFRLVHPSGVLRLSYNGRPITEETAMSVMAFFFLFALSFSTIAILLALINIDYLTAMSAAVTALANVGPGLGEQIGPSGSFASLPDQAKWILAAAMLLGRLELFTVLVMTTPTFWRR